MAMSDLTFLERDETIDHAIEAGQRWRSEQRGARERAADAGERGRTRDADTPDRMRKNAGYLAKKVERTGIEVPAELKAELDRMASGGGAEESLDTFFAERVIGDTRDFLASAFLEGGAFASRCVGRIVVPVDRASEAYGTGFLVSPVLLLTNHHVLRDAEEAARSKVEFDYEIGRLGREKTVRRFGLDPGRFFLSDRDLDFALVAVTETDPSGTTLGSFGYCPLIRDEGKILIDDPVNIIQHPSGRMKQAVVRNNRLVNLPQRKAGSERFAHYTTDTEQGSSGAPVFNDQWDVIALHHSGVPEMDKNNNPLDIDGRVWRKGDGAHRLKWIANEGIRISRLVAFIEKETLTGAQAELRTQLFKHGHVDAGPQERIREREPDPPPAPTPQPHATPIRRFRIPISITIEVGETVEGAGTAAGADLDGFAESARPEPDYDRRKGFDRQFLGVAVDLPKPSGALRRQIRTLTAGGTELKYHHYSVLMHGKRRLAAVSAVNVDLGARHQHERKGGDRWFYDPRLPEDAQVGNEAYEGNPLDRGHLTRRADAAWGRTAAEAEHANNDTFHWTNCAPQHEVYNQSTKANREGVLLWGNLEEHIARQTRNGVRKLHVFNGPILSADDADYRGVVALPKEYWKLVTCLDDEGALKAYAFVLSQQSLIDDLPEEEFRVGPYRPFQITLRDLERRTGFGFGALARHDALESTRSQEAFTGDPDGIIPLGSLRDIVW